MSKTVNFLQALEANKTKRVKPVDGDFYEINELRRSDLEFSLFVGLIEKPWQIEPEVIEFECEWHEAEVPEYVKPVFPVAKNKTQSEFLHSLIGKKTRVRIEVLND